MSNDKCAKSQQADKNLLSPTDRGSSNIDGGCLPDHIP